MKRVLTVAAALIVLIVGTFLYIQRAGDTGKISGKERIKVITSFYPLYYFATQVGGNNIEVRNLLPAGAEPHDHDPNTQDVALIEKSNLLIVNGVGFEPWIDELKDNLVNQNVKVVEVADGIATKTDPHIWLDPSLAKQEVEKIASALMVLDPDNEDKYQGNSINLQNRLESLNQEFQAALSSCKLKNIVTSHAAFGYLAAHYGLNQVSISGLSPDDEPSPRKLAEVAKFAKANNVKYIFFETLVSPRLSETVAAEIGAKTLVFNPLEGLTDEQQRNGQDYFTVQRENLLNLRTALECN